MGNNSIKPKTDTVTVVTDQDKKQKYISKKIVLFVLIILLLAVLAYGVQNMTTQDQRKINALPKNMNTQQKIIYLSDKGEYSAALKVLDDQYIAAKTLSEKQSILFQQTELAIKFKEYDDAKTYINSSMELLPNTPSPYVSSALLAEAQNQKMEARKFWNIAISKLDKDRPEYNLIKRDYESSRDSL